MYLYIGHFSSHTQQRYTMSVGEEFWLHLNQCVPHQISTRWVSKWISYVTLFLIVGSCNITGARSWATTQTHHAPPWPQWLGQTETLSQPCTLYRPRADQQWLLLRQPPSSSDKYMLATPHTNPMPADELTNYWIGTFPVFLT